MSSREDWQKRLGPLYGGAVALVHSTPWRWPVDVGDDARSALWVVVLGVPVGLVAWALAALMHAAGLPPTVASVLGLAALCAASAALVERGLVLSIDRWTGSPVPNGVPAVLALVFGTVVRSVAIMAIAPAHWLWVFVAVAVIGRWAAMFLQALGDPIVHDETVRSLVALPAPAWLTAAISGAVCGVAVAALGKIGVVAMALTAIAVFGLGLVTQRREGGLSVPVVATAAAIGELVTILVATMP